MKRIIERLRRYRALCIGFFDLGHDSPNNIQVFALAGALVFGVLILIGCILEALFGAESE